MSVFAPGDRVELAGSFSFWESGHPGTVVDMRAGLLNGHDCAVILDGRDSPSCWYDRELKRMASA